MARNPEADLARLGDVLELAAMRAPGSGIVDRNGDLVTWPELHRRAGALAVALVDLGVAPGERVVISGRRSIDAFTAVHATLRAGGVVVPVDPRVTDERRLSLLELSQPRVVIADPGVFGPEVTAWCRRGDAIAIRIGTDEPSLDSGGTRSLDRVVAGASAARVSLPPGAPDDDAYIIFTSGSTGTPKGILHSHRSALAYVRAAAQVHAFEVDDRVAATSPLHFDMSTLELYVVPVLGATVVHVPETELQFPASFAARLERERVTALYIVPFLLRELERRGAADQRDLRAVRQVVFGGESMTAELVRDLSRVFPNATFVNLYGPAEVNGVTSHLVDPATVFDPVPIGSAMLDAELLVVDDDGRPVPAGAVGELVVHTPSMMRGYWRRPDLTESAMLDRHGLPHYRTGDIVSQEPDGALLFRGRKDNCVKVRGARVELDEVEAALAAEPGVRHAVAGTDGDPTGARAIIAWVTLDDGRRFDERALRDRCAAMLPPVAVPKTILCLDAVPLTATGKLDRSAIRRSWKGSDV